jgi:hypothetical protein
MNTSTFHIFAVLVMSDRFLSVRARVDDGHRASRVVDKGAADGSEQQPGEAAPAAAADNGQAGVRRFVDEAVLGIEAVDGADLVTPAPDPVVSGFGDGLLG